MATTTCETRLLDVLGRVVRRLTRLAGGLDDGPALTATQRVALVETVEAEPIRLSDLADGLVEHGLLERRPDPDDRRAVRITLTVEGRAIVEERKARVLGAFLPAVATMSAGDQERLIELLAELDDALTALR
jgi:DNA-binding MarR family transcriptional regulator